MISDYVRWLLETRRKTLQETRADLAKRTEDVGRELALIEQELESGERAET